ncbi:MAG: LemA family protein [Firmicutes bacterium ADurb.Bin354]|jgi:LemA protein|nr:MAG: LemA family protein [Firmicutes bacterium ADurb.Bin354]
MTAAIIAIVIVLGIVLIWFIATSNTIKASKLKVEEASSGIDVALTKRYDVLTKQLEVVKQYTSHEAKTMFETIKLRSGMSIPEKQKVLEQMNEVSTQFKLTAEAYPTLLSSEMYKSLMAGIADCEEHLQAARRLYNSNVNSYNTTIAMFPSSIVAGMQGATKQELFTAEEYKRQDVEMKF